LYVPNYRVYRCPADRSLTLGNSGPARVRSYSMSQAVGCQGPTGIPPYGQLPEDNLAGVNQPPQGWQTYAKESQMLVPGPSMLWVLIEEDPDSIDDGGFAFFMAYPANSGTTEWYNEPAKLHYSSSTCIAFADGHMEIHKWLNQAGIDAPTYATYNPEPVGNRTPAGDVDIYWMSERTSAPQ
jgi:hypothetical protein